MTFSHAGYHSRQMSHGLPPPSVLKVAAQYKFALDRPKGRRQHRCPLHTCTKAAEKEYTYPGLMFLVMPDYSVNSHPSL